MPLLDTFVPHGQFVVTGKKKIIQNAQQVEIHEARLVIEEELFVREHRFKWRQHFLKLLEQTLLLRAALIKTAATELAFLVAQERRLIVLCDKFLPVNIVELEAHAFDLVFDEAPENRLHTTPFCGKQTKFHFLIEILCDDLGIVVQLEHDSFAVADDGHAVIAFAREFPDERAVACAWKIGDFETNAGKFEDAPLDEAVRAPRKLNQFNHVKKTSGKTLERM